MVADMPVRDIPVRDLMAEEVVSFSADENVRDAMRALLERDVDAGPVLDGEGRVVGVLSTGDLIVQGSALHLPAVIDILGATLTLPGQARHFERDLEKSLGATVAEVMVTEPVTCGPDDTLETAATLMHDHEVSRLPVVDGQDRLVGIVARGDIVRALVADQDRGRAAGGAEG